MAKAKARRRSTATRKGPRARRVATEVREPVDLGTEEDLRAEIHPVRIAPPAEVEPTEYRNVGVLRKSWLDFARLMRQATQWGALRNTPYRLAPALMLAIISGVRGFNDRIFGIVLPDLVRDLNIDIRGFLTAQNLFGFLVIFATLGLAYYLDRVRRVPFVGIGSIVQGAGSLLIPHIRTTAPLAGLGASDATGRNLSLTPDTSLLNDYYPPDTRGRAFAMFGVLYYIGYYVSPWIVGLVAKNWGWRTPFYWFAPSLVIVGIVALIVLREPIRGYMERRALGLSEDEARRAEPPPTLGHAWRSIWGIRTMRRLFISEMFFRVGEGLYIVYPFFLFQEYGLDAFERGKILGFTGIFSIIGGFLGGGIIDSFLARNRAQRAPIFAGGLQILRAIAIGAIAIHPPFWSFFVLSAFYGFSLAMSGPAAQVFEGLIIPAHFRTLGTMAVFLATVPAILIAQPFLFRVNDWGFRGVLFSAGPFFFLAGLMYMYSAVTFDRDIRNAMASQAASSEYQRAKKAGELKLLVCRDVEVEYDGVQVLFGVDFDVADGEIVALLGTNGAGKSTLLKAISGVQEASGGAVVYDARDITHVPPHEIAARGVAHAPGGRGIFPGLTVGENLELGRWVQSKSGGQDVREEEVSPLSDFDLEEVFEIFPALKDRLKTNAGSLSGGEQQMVSLAQAFLGRPRLLMIDELSLGLSPAVVGELLDCVRRIHERGVTIIVVEQSVNIALTIAERAVFMEKGEVKFIGPTKDLLRRPDILRAVYVKGTGALISGQATTRSERSRRAQDLEEQRAILDVKDLTKSFGGVTAVDHVSFALREGEVLGLIGPNGAGKTTIFDLISGYLAPDEGTVTYDGNDITKLGPDERARLQLIRRFQDARLFPSLTVYETILVALDRRHQARSMALAALQLPGARASERRLRVRADSLIDLLELGAFRDKFVKELSTGLRRISDIACMLATEPRVLLLDEPSSGIAQAEAESLGPLLRRVRVETGCSILIIEHDMPLISRVADELLALDQGRVVTRGTPDDVLEDKRVIESYLGTSEASIRRSGVKV